MKILNVAQGTPEWLALRAKHNCASDAAAMMGVGLHCTRTELLRMKATGDDREFSEWEKKHLLEKGHAAEAYAREAVEKAIGEPLYPITATDDDGYLLASFDGLTMDEETGFECKLWNEDLAAQVRAKKLDPGFYWQLESHFRVNENLKRVIFVVTDGTPAKSVSMEYTPHAGLADALMRGWRQFDEDVAAYQHVEVIPKAVAAPVKSLPVPALKIVGAVEVVASNLGVYADQLRGYIAILPTKPATDQEFADADAGVKALQQAEAALDSASANVLAQFTDIDDVRRTLAQLADLARTTRLGLSKLVEERKKAIRAEIRQEGVVLFAQHLAGLNARLGQPYMPTIPEAFAEKMKGLKSVDSLRNAMNTELARLKIAANEVADRIEMNLRLLRTTAADYKHLFADTAQIVLKPADDLANLVKTRITAEEQRLEGERERIRKEEAEKLEKQAAAQPAAPLAPAPLARPAPPPAGKQSAAPRPSDDEIITALAAHFAVDEARAVEWLLTMNQKALNARVPRTPRAANA